ncbi:MAG: DUF4276 family protein [Alphaproteobacteria bacterium]|nr:DUF4276 family protein [Alphaproteobacteria bacterium]
MAAPTPTPIVLNFMLEEQSAKQFLDVLLPKILPSDVYFRCFPHQGKSELQKSIPLKLKNWRNPTDFFVIVHDQDSNDCIALKQELRELCKGVKSPGPLIRIVCRELEAWYFGDLAAVKKVFPKFRADKLPGNPESRDPDQMHKPSAVLNDIIQDFNKMHAAGEIPKYMNLKLTADKSKSFDNLVKGVKKFAEDCLRACNP